MGPCGQPGDGNLQCWSVLHVNDRSEPNLMEAVPLERSACLMVFAPILALTEVVVATTSVVVPIRP